MEDKKAGSLTQQELIKRNEELEERLNVAEETLRAIREGEVDAVIVSGSKGEQVFSLDDEHDIYRLMVETMNEAGLAVTPDGTILFANNFLAGMLKLPLEQVVGQPIAKFVHPDSLAILTGIISDTKACPADCRLNIIAADGTNIPVHAWANRLDRPDGPTVCLVGVDLTQLESSKEMILHLQEQQDALKKSEERFRSLFENSMDAMFLTTPEGGIIDANAAACVLFGVARETFRRLGFSAIPLSDETQLAQVLVERSRTGLLRKGMTFKHSDGTKIFSEVSSVVINDSQGQARSFVTIRDVTKQRMAEDAVRASAEQHRAILENSLDVIYRLNMKTGHYEYISPSVETVIGFTPDELQSQDLKTAMAMIHSDDLPVMQSALVLLEKAGKASVEYRQLSKNGEYRWLSNRMVLIKDHAGRILYRNGNIRDITDHKQAEKTLSASELRYRRLFESAKDGILILDADTGAIVDVNPFLIQLLDYPREALLEKKVWELGFFKDLVANEANFAELQKQQYIRYEDMPLETSDGRQIHVEFVSNVYQVNDHKVIQCNIRDITDRKRAEEAQAQSLLKIKEINRELNEFAHVVSHDLKSPLRAVSMLSDLLISDYKDKLGKDGQETTALLKARVVQMYSLIEGILEYSRLGRVEAVETCTDIHSVVQRAIDLVDPPGGIKVTVETELPPINCDPLRIQQVFQNLIGNAVKHMDKPEGEVRVGCASENGDWRFYVRDNGPGIEERHHERIFKIFQTLKPKDETSGTGIGLSIVRRIVEGHSGKVWVESKVGEGSTFFFTIPQEKTTKL